MMFRLASRAQRCRRGGAAAGDSNEHDEGVCKLSRGREALQLKAGCKMCMGSEIEAPLPGLQPGGMYLRRFVSVCKRRFGYFARGAAHGGFLSASIFSVFIAFHLSRVSSP